jgi:hypothetical protein
MVYITKDPHLHSVLERLSKENTTIVDFNTAKQISRIKQIRVARKNDNIYIGMDRKKRVSIIYTKKPFKQKGKGFLL